MPEAVKFPLAPMPRWAVPTAEAPPVTGTAAAASTAAWTLTIPTPMLRPACATSLPLCKALQRFILVLGAGGLVGEGRPTSVGQPDRFMTVRPWLRLHPELGALTASFTPWSGRGGGCFGQSLSYPGVPGRHCPSPRGSMSVAGLFSTYAYRFRD